MISLDQKKFEKDLHQAFSDYLGTERCDLFSLAIQMLKGSWASIVTLRKQLLYLSFFWMFTQRM